MADKKVTELDALAAPLVTDLVYGVSDPGGTPVGKKIAISDILALAPPPPTLTAGTYLVSGGAVIWITGLQFTVTAARYYIQGIQYTSAQQDITLADADGTHPRIDVIGLDSAGLVFKVTGTAAASPSEPNVDPTTQIQLAFVTIAALATTPTGVSNEVIYTDAAGSAAEWDFTASGSGFTVNSASSPIAGTKSILCTAPTNGSYAQGARGSGSVEVNAYNYLVFKIKNTSTWAGNRSLLIEFLVSGVLKGSAIQLINGAFGFSGSSTATQIIAIPTVLFGVPIGTAVNQIRFIDNGGSINFRMDDIALHLSGSGQPAVPGGLTQEQADARYIRLANAANTDLALITALPSLSIPKLTLTQGADVAVNSQSLSGTLTLTTTSKRYQSLDPDGSARNVDLPAEAEGLAFFIVNRGDGAEVITVRNDAAGTVDTIDNGEGLSCICDGTRWISAKATLVIV